MCAKCRRKASSINTRTTFNIFIIVENELKKVVS